MLKSQLAVLTPQSVEFLPLRRRQAAVATAGIALGTAQPSS
jgi:hypothetical protein